MWTYYLFREKIGRQIKCCQRTSVYWPRVFSTPESLKFNLDFTSVGSIVSGTGVAKYLETGFLLPLSSISMLVHHKSSVDT